MNESTDAWSDRVARWAESKSDIRALIQIGSRVQAGGRPDAWSDFDYQVVTAAPSRYRAGTFCGELAPCWAFSSEVAFGGAVKVTAVYDRALEADFVIVPHFDLRIAALALRWPVLERWWPAPLRQGIINLRIVAAPGWKVIKGGRVWEKRYARLNPFRSFLHEPEFAERCALFWTQTVWAAKKALRGEVRASQRATHLYLIESSLRLFQEEALLDGRRAYPLGRRAENWLSADQLAATEGTTAPNGRALIFAIARLAQAFASCSERIAERKGWRLTATGEIRKWLEEVAGHAFSAAPGEA